ncbi:hypothetical protein MXB_4663 [Myxobolus squamalis]|nr:hypothetical protein MXB_4663 [Myxobolus squamalis]
MVKPGNTKRRSLTNVPTKKYAQKKSLERNAQSTLYEFYGIRKSTRVSENEKKTKQQNCVHELIKNNIEEGGIFATKAFKKGDFVVEYAGDLTDYKTAIKRERIHEKNNSGSYIIDATSETGRMGRLLNHSRLNFNIISKIIEIDNIPRIVFHATHDIPIGAELLYDYGDRSPQSLKNYPWLRY